MIPYNVIRSRVLAAVSKIQVGFKLDNTSVSDTSKSTTGTAGHANRNRQVFLLARTRADLGICYGWERAHLHRLGRGASEIPWGALATEYPSLFLEVSKHFKTLIG